MQTEPQKPIYKPYTNQLAYNVMKALPEAKILVDSQNIYLYLYGEVKPDLKEWLYSLLETLPEINHPLERVSFVIYVNDSLEKVVIINPSENDVRALEDAVDSKLHFSGGADSSWFKPMPLDHPYYTKGKEK